MRTARAYRRLSGAALLLLGAAPPEVASDNPYALSRAGRPEGQLDEMIDLYRAICLDRFPDDAAIAREVAARQGVAKTKAEVAIYLRGDPGYAWAIAGRSGTFVVTLEMPPYHACGVRAMTRAGFGDMSAYRALVAGYEKAHGDFTAIQPFDAVRDNVRMSGGGEGARLADGTANNLLIFAGTPADAATRNAGNTAVEVRFVHQRVTP